MKAEVEKAQSTILQVASITREQYIEMMFHHGTLFAEYFCRNYMDGGNFLRKLLQDKSYGYWNWFRMQYQHDDVLLINNDCLASDAASYAEMKAAIIGDELLENDLHHYLSNFL